MVSVGILSEPVQVSLSILLTARLSAARAIADFRAAPARASSRLQPPAEEVAMIAALPRPAEEDSMAAGVISNVRRKDV
jgi:hypothetical protein